ncbi:MAG: M20/M25/M40 family metallo-hydrolase [Rhodospirillales bacterium]|nr:M20/M25/M40 family metallo-hydrolase [Rhodospirillales bacterium]
MTAETHAKIREFLTRQRAAQFRFLTGLVRRPTDHPDVDFTEFLDFLVLNLSAFGFRIDYHSVPDARCQAAGRATVTNIVARRSFGPGPTVALAANVDTAPAGEGWQDDPFSARIENGRMFGRGVVSAKGALAAYVFAIQALAEMKTKIAGSVELHITCDGESDGDLGAGWLLAEKLVAPDYVICPGTTYSLISAANGLLQMEAEIRGRSAPASRPENGRDALEAATRVMAAVYGLRSAYAKIKSKIPGINSPSILVSKIQGGESGRAVSERSRLTVTRSLLPEEDVAVIENEITNLIGLEVTRVPGVLCKIRRAGLSLPLVGGDKARTLIDHFQNQAVAVFGNPLPEVGTPNGSMARHYAAAEIPTVLYGVGPANPAAAQVGAANEVLNLDDLRKSTEFLSCVLADILKSDSLVPDAVSARE